MEEVPIQLVHRFVSGREAQESMYIYFMERNLGVRASIWPGLSGSLTVPVNSCRCVHKSEWISTLHWS